MAKFRIVTDSCIDLPASMVSDLGIEVIPMTVTVEGRSYRNFPDEREIKSEVFYDILRSQKVTTTSQLNPADHEAAMTKWLDLGYDILSISFSSALSGSYQSAVIAAKELRERYPERRIVLVDSLCASMGQGLLVTHAARLQMANHPIDTVAQWLEDNKQKISHLFTVADLNHLKRGGRLSAGKAFIGTLIQLKPVLHVDEKGKLVPIGSARGRRHAINRMIDRIAETIEKPEGQTLFLSHGDCLEEAIEMKLKIMERLPVHDVVVHTIGPVIGSHSGVGTIAVFYLGKERSQA